MKLSFYFLLSKVSCCLLKDIFFCLYLSTNSLNVLVLTIILHQSHLTLMILVKYVIVLQHCGKRECPRYFLVCQNNLEMLCLPQNTSLNQHRLFLDHMLQ